MNNRQNNQAGFNTNPYINQQPQMQQGNQAGFNMNQQPQMQQINPNTNQQLSQQPSALDSLFGSIDTENLLKGALVGAIGAYLLTNENAQKAIFKTVAKSADMFSAGMEEMKERFEDAKAEMEAEKEAQ
ncbi:MAG: YtxH domain-containing protein [Campylobacterota bacterium]|nr:YtxH domain-containing protein [Campylobacterota bacterium]